MQELPTSQIFFSNGPCWDENAAGDADW